MPARTHMLPSSNVSYVDTVLAAAPEGTIYACDFYVEGAERGDEVTGGYRLGRLVNIDHHAPTPLMARRVSSANLALDHVRAHGVAGPSETVVINHTDCDSVLSSAIMAGDLPPEPRFGQAAIAADHTGQEDSIADLLQGLDPYRDRDLSLRNLGLLLAGHELEVVAQQGLNDRRRKRDRAARLVGRFQLVGSLAWAVLDEVIDGELFPPLLPQAVVILVASPRDEQGQWNMKLRLGLAAPEGLTLHALKLAEIDPHYGGRWNAGSNRRGGGTAMSPERYAELLAARLEPLLSRRF